MAESFIVGVRTYLIQKIVAQMYVNDARFTAYYDEKQPGAAEFLPLVAVQIYTRTK